MVAQKKKRAKAITPPASGMKVLAVDIETRPNLAYVWGLWNENVMLDGLMEATEMICWAAKWLGRDGTEFRSVHHDGREEMVKRAWHLLDQADAVVHYNGQKFDVPHLNREFVTLGLDPPAPFKQIDLMLAVKKKFNYPTNKLAHVSQALGFKGKVKHHGFRLWLECMDGSDDAWKMMREYNIQDVQLLEDLYERLKPWIPNHPSHAAMTGRDVCPSCGSDELVRQGHAFLKTATYQRFRCKVCGSWSRSTKRDAGTKITEVAT